MFSTEGFAQEVAALVVAAIAFVYVVLKLRGPTAKKSPPVTPVVSDRLARGLAAAEKQKER